MPEIVRAYFAKFVTPAWDFEVGGVFFTPSYAQAAAIVALLFLLVLSLARLRHMYVHWSVGKSGLAMIFWGFVLTLILEGFLLLGGRTLFTEILGWENAPKPISTILDIGRQKMAKVLGDQVVVPSSSADQLNAETVVNDFAALSPSDSQKAKDLICR